VDRVRTLVRSDRRLSVRVITEELNMNKETVRQIVKEDLGMRKISAKMVPRILTHDQKQLRFHILSDILRKAEMFGKIITGDETWCFQYNPETKRQSMQRKHRIHLGRKKHVCLGRRSRSCLCVSSITGG